MTDRIYIALVDTPGLFASLIRLVIRRRYVHVVLGLDPNLEEAYSFGRRNPRIPCFSGFEKEELEQIAGAFPTARYRIYSLECTGEQKALMREDLRRLYRRRYRYHYCVLGLPFLLAGKPFFQKRHYTCSSFLARFLKRHGIDLFEKHFSLVTPADFYDREQEGILFEGTLREFISETACKGRVSAKGVLYEG